MKRPPPCPEEPAARDEDPTFAATMERARRKARRALGLPEEGRSDHSDDEIIEKIARVCRVTPAHVRYAARRSL